MQWSGLLSFCCCCCCCCNNTRNACRPAIHHATDHQVSNLTLINQHVADSSLHDIQNVYTTLFKKPALHTTNAMPWDAAHRNQQDSLYEMQPNALYAMLQSQTCQIHCGVQLRPRPDDNIKMAAE
jgi:hypothetical protein